MRECLRQESTGLSAPHDLERLDGNYEEAEADEPSYPGKRLEGAEEGEELVEQVENGSDAKQHGPDSSNDKDGSQLCRVKNVAGSGESLGGIGAFPVRNRGPWARDLPYGLVKVHAANAEPVEAEEEDEEEDEPRDGIEKLAHGLGRRHIGLSALVVAEQGADEEPGDDYDDDHRDIGREEPGGGEADEHEEADYSDELHRNHVSLDPSPLALRVMDPRRVEESDRDEDEDDEGCGEAADYSAAEKPGEGSERA